MKEYLKEFFDIKLDISLELDGFKVTQGSLKDDDIVNIVKCTKKRPRYSSSSSSPSSSSVSSDSSSEEEQASATTTIPPHSGTSKTHKRNARNKKKLKFQKFENKRVIPYSSLPTNRIPNNIKVTSIDVENANFEPGNNTTHVDWRDLDVNEEVEQVHQQQEGYQADAEQSYMDISSAPPPIPLQSLESLDILLDINFPDNELKPIEQFKAYLGGFKEIDSTVDHFKAIANEKMSRGETLTELPPVGSFIAYNELQLNNKNVPELQIMISKVLRLDGDVVLLLRAYYTEHMITEIEDQGPLKIAELSTPIFLDTLLQSNAVLL